MIREATADVRPNLEKADEPGVAEHEKYSAKTGHIGNHGFSRGAPYNQNKMRHIKTV